MCSTLLNVWDVLPVSCFHGFSLKQPIFLHSNCSQEQVDIVCRLCQTKHLYVSKCTLLIKLIQEVVCGVDWTNNFVIDGTCNYDSDRI